MRCKHLYLLWRYLIPLLLGLCISASLGVIALSRPEFMELVQVKIYDLLTRSHSPRTESSLPIYLNIDEASLAQYGQWPWSRRMVAELFEEIDALGAAVISADVVFAEPDQLSPKRIADDLHAMYQAAPDLSRIPPEYQDYDTLLAHTLADGNFVLGYSFHFKSRPSAPPKINALRPLNAVLRQTPNAPELPDYIPEPTDVIANLPILSRAAQGAGFLNINRDPDGVVRRAPLLMPYGDRLYPSLVLATMLSILHPKNIVLDVTDKGIDSLVLDDLTVPLDNQGNLMLRFRGPRGTFNTVSALDVLQKRLPPGAFLGKAVFVGSSAIGLNDLHATPRDKFMPGTEIQLTILDNLIQGDFLRRPAWALDLEILTTLLLGLGVALLLAFTSALWSLPAVLLCTAAVWGFSAWSLNGPGYFLSPLYPTLAIVLNFVLLNLFKYIREERLSRAQTQELINTQQTLLLSMASLVETRDPETGQHIQRTQFYVRILAQGLRKLPKYKDLLTPDEIELLYKSSPLHDIGKVGVPDHILLKPGPLTAEEFEEMKKHTIYGYEALSNADSLLGDNSFLRLAKEIALYHHEKWDGSGYPFGLKGDATPLPGRLMALADVYDALISRRIYKAAFPHSEAKQVLLDGRGSHFDPEIVDVFLQYEQEFLDISHQYPDE